MASSTSSYKSLKEYLKRYESNINDDQKKKKKKQLKKAKPDAAGVLVVDEDPVWQKPVNLEEEEEEEDANEKPQIDEDIEVKRMKRLELLRAQRPYNSISEDGSGWVALPPPHSNRNDSNSDMSPSRKQRARNDTPLPESARKRLDSEREDIDISQPRPGQRSPHSPSPKSELGPSSDLPSPRKRRARNDTPSPSQIGRESEDLSPPRHRKRHWTPSPEPNRGPSHSTRLSPDLSPPRKQRARNDTPSPSRCGKANTDMSPPRRKRHEIRLHEHDMSSPRQSQRQTQHDISLPRRPHHFSFGKDLSPPRMGRKDVERVGLRDLSPPRKNRKNLSAASAHEERKTGLISGRDIRDEIAKKKEEDWKRFQEMDPSISGRGAEPVYRDKKGERITKEEFSKSKKKVEEKPKEKKLEWIKGLAQKREAEAKLQELELEKEKPFSRSRDDPELDNLLKERVRWGDPMAHLVQKKYPGHVLSNLGDNEKMKESGFIVPQDIPNHSWLKRGIDAPPNRYGIRPGRHWDGVDRSNGYEKEMFKRTNEKQATQREAYLWSVADM